jgi:hypothetical protein
MPISDFKEDDLAKLKSDDITLSKKEVEFLILNEIKIIDPFLQEEQNAICLEFL